jgi:hypothetical protein
VGEQREEPEPHIRPILAFMSEIEPPGDDYQCLAAIERLDQLIADLTVQRDQLAKGSFRTEGSARIQAVVPVQVALQYVREALTEIVGELHAFAGERVDVLINAAAPDLDAEALDDLRDTSALLLGDILVVSQLDGSIGPDLWQPILPSLVVNTVRAAQERDELRDEADDL